MEIPAPDFDLEKTLDSGQVFHWEKIGKGFVGTIGEFPVYIEQRRKLLRARVASPSSRNFVAVCESFASRNGNVWPRSSVRR